MKLFPICMAVLAAAATSFAQTGNDDCSLAPATDALIGNGTWAFDNTGATIDVAVGQSDIACLAGGLTNFTADVWFEWTADADGLCVISTGGTGDPKLGVYLASGCPAAGTVVACTDDFLSFLPTVSFVCTANDVYMIQLGASPQQANAVVTGNFTVEIRAHGCGTLDDGTTETSLGLTAGGQICMMNRFTCLDSVDEVQVAYGQVPAGNAVEIAVWDDVDMDGNPSNAVRVSSHATVVTNPGTGIFNIEVLPAPAVITGDAWVGAIISQQAGEFPAPMDFLNYELYPNSSFTALEAVGTPFDSANLAANAVPPVPITATGFAAVWLLRATGTETSGVLGTTICAGDGTGSSACPCANESVLGTAAGCKNSTGAGATITASGSALFANDNLGFSLAGAVPNQPCILVQGATLIGMPFKDGLLCMGNPTDRVGRLILDASGAANTTVSIITEGAVPGPGTTRYYQFWYLDPGGGGPCGIGSNFSNALRIDYI